MSEENRYAFYGITFMAMSYGCVSNGLYIQWIACILIGTLCGARNLCMAHSRCRIEADELWERAMGAMDEKRDCEMGITREDWNAIGEDFSTVGDDISEAMRKHDAAPANPKEQP